MLIGCEEQLLKMTNVKPVEEEKLEMLELEGNQLEEIAKESVEENINSEGEVSKLIDDVVIEKQLEKLEALLSQYPMREDAQQLLDQEYHRDSVGEEGLYMPDAGLYSGWDTFIYNDYKTEFKFQKGDTFYTYNVSNYEIYENEVVDVTKESITIESEDAIQTVYDKEELYFDQVIMIKNLLETRKAGIMVAILYTRDGKMDQASIFYVNGEANKINQITYGSDGIRKEYTDTQMSNRYRN